MADKINNLRELFEHEIKDLYSAETQLIEALPKMAEKANDPKLQRALRDHLEVTKNQKDRLKKVANLIEMDPEGEKCKAMEGLVKEGESLMKKDMDPDVMDAAIIAAAQRVEHYEISGYGTAATYAKMLSMDKAADLLHTTLTEERDTDSTLNKIAMGKVNQKAEA